jgi:iron(III) transport system substrate-binding protein
MRHQISRKIVVLGTLAIIPVAAGCSSGSSSSSVNQGTAASSQPASSTSAGASSGGSPYSQAKAEGNLTFYCAQDPVTCAGLGSAFQKAYPGITVDALQLQSATLGTRFTSEKEAHAATADVVMLSDFSFLSTAQNEGFLLPWSKADITGYSDIPKQWLDPVTGDPFTYVTWGIAYNTQMVSASQVPKTWSDLLDPQWKGKLVESACQVSKAAAVGWGTIASYVPGGSAKFLQALSKQNMSENTGGEEGASAEVAAGEYALQPVANAGNVTALKQKGAPIAITFPSDTTGPPYGVGLNAQPDHPAAQKLFAQWLISKAGEEALHAANPYSVSQYAGPATIKSVTPNLAFFNDPDYTQTLGPQGLNCLSS